MTVIKNEKRALSIMNNVHSKLVASLLQIKIKPKGKRWMKMTLILFG